MRSVTHAEWIAEAKRIFGDDPLKWRFVCPVCGHEASVADWKGAGATQGEVAFSCVGRRMGATAAFDGKTRPCNYAGGGLFKLNPVTVTMPDGRTLETFEFASVNP